MSIRVVKRVPGAEMRFKALLLVLCVLFPAVIFAVNEPYSYVDDRAGLFTAAEVAKLQETAHAAAAGRGIFKLVTLDAMPEAYAGTLTGAASIFEEYAMPEYSGAIVITADGTVQMFVGEFFNTYTRKHIFKVLKRVGDEEFYSVFPEGGLFEATQELTDVFAGVINEPPSNTLMVNLWLMIGILFITMLLLIENRGRKRTFFIKVIAAVIVILLIVQAVGALTPPATDAAALTHSIK